MLTDTVPVGMKKLKIKINAATATFPLVGLRKPFQFLWS